jgi:hypothetical protein
VVHNEVDEEIFERMLQPLLSPHKDSHTYSQRKDAILAVLHSAFKRLDTKKDRTYLMLLRKFVDYYTHSAHDRSMDPRGWNGADVLPPGYMGTSKRAFLSNISEEFSDELIGKLSRFYCDLDIKLYHLLFWKVNSSRNRMVIDSHSCDVKKIEETPLYLEPILDSFYYLDSDELLLQHELLERYFKAASGQTCDHMLELFLNSILKHDCASPDANTLFKSAKCGFTNHLRSDMPDYRVKFINKTVCDRLQAYHDANTTGH